MEQGARRRVDEYGYSLLAASQGQEANRRTDDAHSGLETRPTRTDASPHEAGTALSPSSCAQWANLALLWLGHVGDHGGRREQPDAEPHLAPLDWTLARERLHPRWDRRRTAGLARRLDWRGAATAHRVARGGTDAFCQRTHLAARGHRRGPRRLAARQPYPAINRSI